MAKPGGLLSFTHKTSVWPDWEVEQDRLEAAGLWQKVWVSISKVTKYHEVMTDFSIRSESSLSCLNSEFY